MIIYNKNMESVIFDSSVGEKILKVKPSRFDMAINFYAIIKKDNSYYLVTYFYNPTWNLYYPFYDDINKTPVLKESKAKNFSELLEETNKNIAINENEKVTLAKNRFEELIGCKCNVVKSSVNHILYELKYSKTSGKYSVYKLYNYIITDISNINKLIHPKLLQCKLFELSNLDENKIVSNAIYFVNLTKDELKKYALTLN